MNTDTKKRKNSDLVNRLKQAQQLRKRVAERDSEEVRLSEQQAKILAHQIKQMLKKHLH